MKQRAINTFTKLYVVGLIILALMGVAQLAQRIHVDELMETNTVHTTVIPPVE